MRYYVFIISILFIILFIAGCTDSKTTQIKDSSVSGISGCLGGSCMQSAFDECKSTVESFAFHQDIPLEVKTSIEGKEGDACIIKQEVIKDDTGLGFQGKSMTCKIPEDYDIDKMNEYCEGSLIDLILGVEE